MSSHSRRSSSMAVLLLLPLLGLGLSGCGTAVVVAGATTYVVAKTAVKATVGTARMVGRGVSKANERARERRAERAAEAAMAEPVMVSPYQAPLPVSPAQASAASGLY